MQAENFNMAKFHSLKVIDVKKETADSVSVAFDVPAALKSDFSFLPGQYLTLKLKINGEEIRRSYSICSSPFANEALRIAIKKVKDGKGSNYLNDQLQVGASIEVMSPMGNFHSPLHPEHQKHYLLFAGGSGITPMLSIIKSVLEKEAKSNITLFYCNKNEEQTIFRSELEHIAQQAGKRLVIKYILEEPAEQVADIYMGLLDATKVNALIENHGGLQQNFEIFICGPTPMMQIVESALKNLQIDPKRVHIEYFTAALESAKNSDSTAENITSHVTIVIDGDETILAIETAGPAILDAAIDADLDVPFACKGAVCCTCRAKVLEGKVIMDNNFALSEEEVAEGYILTCQAHPVTAIVKVDYDQA